MKLRIWSIVISLSLISIKGPAISLFCPSLGYSLVIESGSDKEIIAVTDGAGRVVSVQKDSNLMLLICEQEVIRLLGAQNRVVAVHRWLKENSGKEVPEMIDKPVIGSFSPGEVNYERIVEIASETMGEDIVITYAESFAEDIETILDPIPGIKVLKFDLHNPDVFESQLTALAEALGKGERCIRFLEWRKRIQDPVLERVKLIPEDKRLKVYWDASGNGTFDSQGGSGSASSMIAKAGGKIITKDIKQQYCTVSPEWLVAQNPDLIVSHGNNLTYSVGIRMGLGITPELSKLEEAIKIISMQPGISNTKAGRNNQIYFIADDLMYGPKQVIGILYLVKWFYPDHFKDIDPDKTHEEYYREFMALDYSGISAYPISSYMKGP